MFWQRNEIYFLSKKIRLKHWIKNFIIFIPAIDFSIRTQADTLAFLFFVLCFAASANYVLNDFLDRKIDALSLTKIGRQPTGFFDVAHINAQAGLFITLLSCAGLFGFFLNTETQALLGLFVISSMAYSLFFKKLKYIDLLFINFLYLLRCFSGFTALGLKYDVSLVLFLTVYFFYLSVVKRGIDLENFKDSAWSHGRFYGTNSKKLVKLISTTAFFFLNLCGLFYITQSVLSPKKTIFVLVVLLSSVFIQFIKKNHHQRELIQIFLEEKAMNFLLLFSAGLIFIF